MTGVTNDFSGDDQVNWDYGDHKATCLCATSSLTRLLRYLSFASHSICCPVVYDSDSPRKL